MAYKQKSSGLPFKELGSSPAKQKDKEHKGIKKFFTGKTDDLDSGKVDKEGKRIHTHHSRGIGKTAVAPATYQQKRSPKGNITGAGVHGEKVLDYRNQYNKSVDPTKVPNMTKVRKNVRIDKEVALLQEKIKEKKGNK